MEKPEILYEDEAIIVVKKPAGMSSQDDSLMAMDMVSYLKNYLVRSGRCGKDPYLAVVHRLDRPVGGIMVYARTREAAAGLSVQVQKREMEKHYYAVLDGVPAQKKGTLKDLLVSDGPGHTVRVVLPGEKSAKGAKQAILTYEVVAAATAMEKRTVPGDTLGCMKTSEITGHPLALADIHLLTGRHHQIRVQMLHLGCPLWGDSRYNPRFQKRRGGFALALYAYKLSFRHPVTGKAMKFETAPGSAITDHFPGWH